MKRPSWAEIRGFFRPARAVLAGLFVVWVAMYWSLPHEPRSSAAGHGKYEPIMARGDGHYIYMNLLSIVFDGDIQLQDQYKQFGDPFSNGPTVYPSGYCFIYPIGTAVLQTPAFLVAHATSKVANLFGAGIPAHGYSRWHQRITFFSTLLAGFAAIVFAWRLARRHVGETVATWAAVVVGLGTAIFFYGVYWVSYNHAWTALGVAWLLDHWDATRGRTDWKRWAALGALVGLCGLTRLQEVTFALVPAVEWAVLFWQRRDQRLQLLTSAAAATLCAVLVASPQLYANWRVFGGVFEVGQPNYMRWESPFWWEPLFSTRNGLFVWTPLAYAGVLGLFAARRETRGLAGFLLLGFATQVYVNGCAWSWWFDWSFSARRFVDSTAIFVVGIAFLLARAREVHARWPRLAPHLAVALAFAPLVIMNLELSRAVARSKQRVGVPVDTSALYSGSLKRLLDGLSSSVGSPSTWPASWIWAATHGVPPGKYEDLVGQEKLIISNHDLHKKRASEKFDFTQKGVVEQFGVRRVALENGATVVRDGGRIALPLFLEDELSVTIVGTPGEAAEVSFGGSSYPLVAPETKIAPAPLEVGTNVLTFRCAVSPCLTLTKVEVTYEPAKD